MNLILIYSYLLPRQPVILQFSNTDMSLLYPVQIWHVFTISGSNLHFNTRTDWLIGIVNLNTIDIFLESVLNKLPLFFLSIPSLNKFLFYLSRWLEILTVVQKNPLAYFLSLKNVTLDCLSFFRSLPKHYTLLG